jgi:hypothetical protein
MQQQRRQREQRPAGPSGAHSQEPRHALKTTPRL